MDGTDQILAPLRASGGDRGHRDHGDGYSPPMDPTAGDAESPSPKSRGVALTLAALLGPFGGHRFYVNKLGTGVLMAATVGGLGLWRLYDLILVASGSFRDADGRLVRRWDPEEALPV